MHPLHLAFEAAIELGGLPPSRAGAFSRDQLRIERPVRDQPWIDLFEAVEGHRLGERVQLVPEQPGAKALGGQPGQAVPGPRPERGQQAGQYLPRPAG